MGNLDASRATTTQTTKFDDGQNSFVHSVDLLDCTCLKHDKWIQTLGLDAVQSRRQLAISFDARKTCFISTVFYEFIIIHKHNSQPSLALCFTHFTALCRQRRTTMQKIYQISDVGETIFFNLVLIRMSYIGLQTKRMDINIYSIPTKPLTVLIYLLSE